MDEIRRHSGWTLRVLRPMDITEPFLTLPYRRLVAVLDTAMTRLTDTWAVPTIVLSFLPDRFHLTLASRRTVAAYLADLILTPGAAAWYGRVPLLILTLGAAPHRWRARAIYQTRLRAGGLGHLYLLLGDPAVFADTCAEPFCCGLGGQQQGSVAETLSSRAAHDTSVSFEYMAWDGVQDRWVRGHSLYLCLQAPWDSVSVALAPGPRTALSWARRSCRDPDDSARRFADMPGYRVNASGPPSTGLHATPGSWFTPCHPLLPYSRRPLALSTLA